MGHKIFGIDPDNRIDIPTGNRRDGQDGGKGMFNKYFNQALFEVHQDQIIGTASQLTTGDATLKYLFSDQTLRDKNNNIVVLNDGDRIYIIGLDTLTDDFDLSAYDRLRIVSDPSITLDNSSQDLIFGDDCFLDINESSTVNKILGAGCYGYINKIPFPFSEKQYLGDTAGALDFIVTATTAISSITRAMAIPYQTNDGAWHLAGKISLAVGTSGGARTITAIIISGVIYKTGPSQMFSGTWNNDPTYALRCLTGNGTANLNVNHVSATAGGNFDISFDVELDSKPTWAD